MSSTPATSHWSITLSQLFNHQLVEEKIPFCKQVSTLCGTLLVKSGDRNCSVSLKNPAILEEMVEEVFKAYVEQKSPLQLCELPLMKELATHTADNDRYLDFIRQKVVPSVLNQMQEKETWGSSEKVLDWFTHLHAGLCESANLSKQAMLYRILPTEKHEHLSNERSRIGMQLSKAFSQQWLTKADIQTLCDKLRTSQPADETPPFSKESIIPYFIDQYARLILSGKEYREVFQDSLLFGLQQYLRALPPS